MLVPPASCDVGIESTVVKIDGDARKVTCAAARVSSSSRPNTQWAVLRHAPCLLHPRHASLLLQLTILRLGGTPASALDPVTAAAGFGLPQLAAKVVKEKT